MVKNPWRHSTKDHISKSQSYFQISFLVSTKLLCGLIRCHQKANLKLWFPFFQVTQKRQVWLGSKQETESASCFLMTNMCLDTWADQTSYDHREYREIAFLGALSLCAKMHALHLAKKCLNLTQQQHPVYCRTCKWFCRWPFISHGQMGAWYFDRLMNIIQFQYFSSCHGVCPIFSLCWLIRLLSACVGIINRGVKLQHEIETGKRTHLVLWYGNCPFFIPQSVWCCLTNSNLLWFMYYFMTIIIFVISTVFGFVAWFFFHMVSNNSFSVFLNIKVILLAHRYNIERY